MNKLSIKDELTEFLLYTSPNGEVKVEVILNQETVWLTQKAIAQLFGVQVPAISKHLKNIFDCGELDENSVVSILETTAADSKSYQVFQQNKPKKEHLLNTINSIEFKKLKAISLRP